MDEMKSMQDVQKDLESKLAAANDKSSELNEYADDLSTASFATLAAHSHSTATLLRSTTSCATCRRCVFLGTDRCRLDRCRRFAEPQQAQQAVQDAAEGAQSLRHDHQSAQRRCVCFLSGHTPPRADLSLAEIAELKKRLESRSQSMRVKPTQPDPPVDDKETIWGNFQHKSGKQLGLKLKTEFGVNIFRVRSPRTHRAPPSAHARARRMVPVSRTTRRRSSRPGGPPTSLASRPH